MARPSKRQKTNSVDTTSRASLVATSSPTSPSTLPTLPQVYSIDSCISAGGCTIDQTNRYLPAAAAVTNQLADTLSVTHIPASSSNRDLNAPSTQADNCPLAPPTSCQGSFMSVGAGGETNNPASQAQAEGTSQNAHYITPDQAIVGGNGDLVPLARLQTTLSHKLGTELNHDTENSGNISYIDQEPS